MLIAWHVYLPIDRQSILSSVKLPSYLFCSSFVSNIHLMIDCGILSTVQVIVVVSLSFTSLSLEILEMVGWSTSNDKFKSICICLRPLWLIMKHQKTIKFYFLFLVLVVILNVRWVRRTQCSFKGQLNQFWFNLVQCLQRRRFKCDLYENMSNLHNRYKSAERKMSQKTLEYMLNYS